LLQGHAIWIEKRWSNIPTIDEKNVLGADREEHGVLRGRYVGEKYIGDQTRPRPR
jgi:hypothetical protein